MSVGRAPTRAERPTIEFRGVSKSYDDATALQPTSLVLGAGLTTALIGPSGCGKSTILRLINGLIEPDAGAILIGGRILDPGDLAEARRRMGYVIQGGGLFPHLTAAGNAGLMAEYLGWEPSRLRSRMVELADLVQLDARLLTRFPGELSGGQAQRVALIRALMLEPEVLLLDEPMAALDPLIRADLQSDLRDIFGRLRTTVVLVTHDLAEAAYLADDMVLMRDGRVIQEGHPADVVATPNGEFARRFVRAQRFLHADGEG